MKTQEQARERLDKELTAAAKSSNRYVAAVAQAVHDALVGFIAQQEEFARAVVQSDKTLADVCAAAMKKVGGAISDIEVYRRVVAEYFPGAQVDCVMTIRMSEHEGTGEPETAKSQTSGDVLSLDLFDLMGG